MGRQYERRLCHNRIYRYDVQPTVWKKRETPHFFLVGLASNHGHVSGCCNCWFWPGLGFFSFCARAVVFKLIGAGFTGEILNPTVIDNIEWFKAENHQPLVVWLMAHVRHHTCLSNRTWPHMARKSREVMAIKPLHLMWDIGQVGLCFTQEKFNFAEVTDFKIFIDSLFTTMVRILSQMSSPLVVTIFLQTSKLYG